MCNKKSLTGREGPFADTINKHYPLGSKVCICAAASAIRRDFRLGKISDHQFEQFMSRVRQQARRLGVNIRNESSDNNTA